MAGQQFPEGTVADGPNGPIVFRNGGWQSMAGARPAPQVVKLGDPRQPYIAPLSAAELAAKAQEAKIRTLQIKKMEDEATGSNGGLEPSAIDMIAHQYILSGTLPPLGMGQSAAADRRAILNQVAHIVGARSGESLQVGISRYKNGVKAIGNLENQLGTISTNEGTASANAEQYLSAIRKVYPQDSWALGNAGRALGRKLVNDPDYTAYDTARNTFLTEYAKVVAGTPTGAGTLSDSARREQMDVLKSTTSPSAAEAAIKQMRADMRNRVASYQTNIQRGYSNLEAGRSISATSNGDLVDEQGKVIAPDRDAAPAAGMTGATNPSPGQGGPPTLSGGGGQGIGGPGMPGGPPMDGTQQFYRNPAAGAGGGFSVPTEGKISVPDPQRAALADKLSAMVGDRRNADQAVIGFAQQSGLGVTPGLLAQLKFRKDHPDYNGAYKAEGFGFRDVPMTGTQKVLNAVGDSSIGAGAINAGISFGELGNGLTGGALEHAFGDPQQNRTVINAINAQHPIAAPIGSIGGGVIGAAGAERAALSLAGKFGTGAVGRVATKVAPYVGDAAFGAAQGAGAAEDGNRLNGAMLGAVAGAAGGMLGRKVIGPAAGRIAATAPVRAATTAVSKVGNAFANGVRSSFDKPMVPFSPTIVPPKPSIPENMILGAAKKGDVADIQAQLSEAAAKGYPLSLADTSPELTSLAGAAARRSPTAAGFAESQLLPRARGQIDRFGQQLESNLGAVGDVPKATEDLLKSAKTKAGPLYDQAYAAGQVNDPQINQLMQHPELKAAYDAAQTLHGNDTALALASGKAPPAPLTEAYTLDPSHPDGFRLTTPPDVRTLDYIQRGLRARADNAYTGSDSQAKMSAPFLKDARKLLLARTDTAVPAFGAARAAYAGPMQAADALAAGQGAAKPGMTPGQLGVDIGNAAPGDVPHMQLGYRSALMDQANGVRYSGNPFDATLGTPNAEKKLGIMYADNPQGVKGMLGARDAEAKMARTNNSVLGNSMTAQRGLADQSFTEGGMPQMMLDASLNIATGQVPIGLIARKGTLQAVKDAYQMGVGKRAVAKADALAPTLFTTDPAQASASLGDILNTSQAYRDFMEAQGRKYGNVFGSLGTAIGPGIAARR